jgi:hypothetical protein
MYWNKCAVDKDRWLYQEPFAIKRDSSSRKINEDIFIIVIITYNIIIIVISVTVYAVKNIRAYIIQGLLWIYVYYIFF